MSASSQSRRTSSGAPGCRRSTADRALAAVVELEAVLDRRGLLEAHRAGVEVPPGIAPRRLDLDHVGPEVGEQRRGRGRRQPRRRLDHADARQRSRHRTPPAGGSDAAAGEARGEIGAGPEDELLADARLGEEAERLESEQVGAGGGVGHAVSPRLRLDREPRIGITHRVAHEHDLAVVEVRAVAQQPLGPPLLLHLPLEVVVQALDRALDDRELVEHEVGDVAAVGLDMQVRPRVLRGRPAEDAGDREVLRQPVAGAQHRPVEEGARRPAVAVGEGMVVGEREVQHDRAHHGVDEALAAESVGELAQPIEACRKIRSRRRAMDDRPVSPLDDHALVLGTLKPAGFAPVIERVEHDDAMQIEDVARRQETAVRRQRGGGLQHLEIVEDHLLAAVARLAAAAQHLPGDAPCRARALELARRDRLLVERTHEVAVARLEARHHLAGDDLAARLLIDAVNQLLDPVGVAEVEGPPLNVGQGQRPGDRLPRQRHAEPPRLVAEAVGRGAAAQLVPVQVAAPGIDGAACREDAERPLRIAGELVEQPVGRRRRLRDLHGATLNLLSVVIGLIVIYHKAAGVRIPVAPRNSQLAISLSQIDSTFTGKRTAPPTRPASAAPSASPRSPASRSPPRASRTAVARRTPSPR